MKSEMTVDQEIKAVEKWLGGGSVCMLDVCLYRTYGKNGKVGWTEAMTKSIEDYRKSKEPSFIRK